MGSKIIVGGILAASLSGCAPSVPQEISDVTNQLPDSTIHSKRSASLENSSDPSISPLDDHSPGGLVEAIALPLASSGLAAQDAPTRAVSRPHGDEVCASGCAVSHHPTPALPLQRYQNLLVEYAGQPADQTSEPLDELIYYGRQVQRRLKSSQLPEQHMAFLQTELAKEKLVLELRVVDELGAVRVALPATSVPQHVRQEFKMDVSKIQPILTSGTLKRVGLNHVWQRL